MKIEDDVDKMHAIAARLVRGRKCILLFCPECGNMPEFSDEKIVRCPYCGEESRSGSPEQAAYLWNFSALLSRDFQHRTAGFLFPLKYTHVDLPRVSGRRIAVSFRHGVRTLTDNERPSDRERIFMPENSEEALRMLRKLAREPWVNRADLLTAFLPFLEEKKKDNGNRRLRREYAALREQYRKLLRERNRIHSRLLALLESEESVPPLEGKTRGRAKLTEEEFQALTWRKRESPRLFLAVCPVCGGEGVLSEKDGMFFVSCSECGYRERDEYLQPRRAAWLWNLKSHGEGDGNWMPCPAEDDGRRLDLSKEITLSCVEPDRWMLGEKAYKTFRGIMRTFLPSKGNALAVLEELASIPWLDRGKLLTAMLPLIRRLNQRNDDENQD